MIEINSGKFVHYRERERDKEMEEKAQEKVKSKLILFCSLVCVRALKADSSFVSLALLVFLSVYFTCDVSIVVGLSLWAWIQIVIG